MSPGSDNKTGGASYLVFLLVLGVAGWGALVALTVFDPGLGHGAATAAGDTALTRILAAAMFFVLVAAARGLDVPMGQGIRVSLDTALHVAAAVCLGPVAAGWVVGIALLLDSARRALFARGRRGARATRTGRADTASRRATTHPRRAYPRRATTHPRRATTSRSTRASRPITEQRYVLAPGAARRQRPIIYALYFGGMTGGLLAVCGHAVLSRLTGGAPVALGGSEWIAIAVVLALGASFVTCHYALQAIRHRLLGGSFTAFIRRVALRGIPAELALLPLAMVAVRVYEPARPLGLALLGATFLLCNYGYNRLIRAGAQLERRIADLETLSTAARRLSASLQLAELVEVALREASLAIPRADIAMLAHGGSHREERLAVDFYDRERDAYERIHAGRDEGATGWVMRHQKPLSTADLSAGDLDVGGVADAGIRAWMGVPVVLDGAAEGVLSVQSRRTGAFDDHDLRLLESLGVQVGVALANAHLYRLAMIDGLTGLYVRRYFDARIDEEIQRADRYGEVFSVIMMDIDEFKALNDTHGHIAGDQMLCAIAELIRAEMRGVDTAARYGGEEIAVVLPRTDMVSAYNLAERIRAAIAEQRISADGAVVGVTASFGIAEYPESGARDAEDLVRRADHALYRAKKTGKNRVELYWADADQVGKSSVRSV